MKLMTDPLSAPPWPPTTFSLPELWTRITAMFAVLMREARSTAQLAMRMNTTRNERHAIRCRLIPLEKLVRSLLITEALIHLLMTKEGRDLFATARPVTPPARQHDAAPQSQAATQISPPPSRERPHNFRVLGWQTLTGDDNSSFAPTHTPQDDRDHAAPVSTRHLARRIETLARVMKDREPTVMRLAKFIAGLPNDALDLPAALGFTSLSWWHGRPEYFNAIALEKRAVIAFRCSAYAREEPD